jgi:uncharacterized protein YcbX
LRLYPFKSLDGVDVESAPLAERGGLRHDRAFALVDERGALVNGKSEPLVYQLRVTYDAGVTRATFASPHVEGPFVFAFDDEPAALEGWLGRHFGRAVTLQHDANGGFPDDPRAPGPTIVSLATLATVAAWFPELSVDDVRRRLRANVELDGVPAFWEDTLFGSVDETIPFRIGETQLEGTNPCARCIVPSRDAETGAPLAGFQKIVAEQRAATLPLWSDRSRFDHFYRLTLNTRPAPDQAGRVIRLGDTAVRERPVSRA